MWTSCGFKDCIKSGGGTKSSLIHLQLLCCCCKLMCQTHTWILSCNRI